MAQIDDTLKSIPPATAVREKLASNIREGRILRQLLKVAERADRERAGTTSIAFSHDQQGGAS